MQESGRRADARVFRPADLQLEEKWHDYRVTVLADPPPSSAWADLLAGGSSAGVGTPFGLLARPAWAIQAAVPSYELKRLTRRVQYSRSRVWAEAIWIEGAGESVCIRGVEHARSRVDIDRAVDGVSLLKRLGLAGRPRGSGVTPKAEFVAGLRKGINALQRERRKVTQAALAKRVAMHRTTLIDYLNHFELRWSDVKVGRVD